MSIGTGLGRMGTAGIERRVWVLGRWGSGRAPQAGLERRVVGKRWIVGEVLCIEVSGTLMGEGGENDEKNPKSPRASVIPVC